MKMKHPMYGIFEIPDKKEEIENALCVTRAIMEEEYYPVVLAYQDMLESSLDNCRRDEDGI